MKTLYILLITILLTINCKAQSPIIDIEEYSYITNSLENAYYKDINNFFAPFVGTWLYTNGSTSFKIVLTKYSMEYTGKFYTDVIIGEYQYIEDGVEIRNTLTNTDIYNVGISGSSLVKGHRSRPICTDCTEDERRLRLIIRDRDRGLSGSFTLQLITSLTGEPAIKGFIYGSGVGAYDIDNPPPFFQMAFRSGYYTFIKQ